MNASDLPGRSRLGWAAALIVSLLVSCGAKQGDFGTLPEVSIPIEKQPEQDPTLFQDEPDEPAPAATSSDPPDPAPLRSKDLYDFVLQFNKGTISVIQVRDVQLERPQSTVRRVGRFALELWTGEQLVERVRFDFPLLGASDESEPDPLSAGLVSQVTVRVPAASRARSARILDRKTREIVEISWPPETSERAAPKEPDSRPEGS